MLTVGEFTGSSAEWDDFVRRQSGWTHCHLSGWRDVMHRVHGHEGLYLAAWDGDGALAGVLPLVRLKSMIFGHFLVSMPFLNYGGPLGSEAAVRALVNHASTLVRRSDIELLELRSRAPIPVELPVSHRKITVLLDLPAGDPEALWRGLPSGVRSDVRRPRGHGVTVRFGPNQLPAFYGVFAHHMRDLGTPVQPRRFFEAMLETFSHDCWIACAYHQGQPIACGFGLRWNDEVEITWASALAAFRRIGANMLLYWSFMERAAREGLRVFNFGRCSPGGGTHRFKRQWGTRDEQLWWYDLAMRPGAITPSPDDSRYAWGPRLWRRLPVTMATALGPHIVRGIP